jgi:lysozyme family protein
VSYFEQAITTTLQHEGGYVNDPHDPGGETRYGISKRAFPGVDIKALTLDQAKAIYHASYWDKGAHLIKHYGIAAKYFDLCVNAGVSRASKWLQEASDMLGAALTIDGRVGPATSEWVNRYPHPEALLCALKGLAFNHYVSLGKPRFLAGWLNRLGA